MTIPRARLWVTAALTIASLPACDCGSPLPGRSASAEQVAAFWKSFRTFRDLAIVALMLLDGLRSCEVLQLQLADLSLSEAHLCVLGKGNKKRVLPLPAETIEVLQNYLPPAVTSGSPRQPAWRRSCEGVGGRWLSGLISAGTQRGLR